MKSKIITAMSIIMLVGLMFLGYFIIPIGIPICSIIGLTYGSKQKINLLLNGLLQLYYWEYVA